MSLKVPAAAVVMFSASAILLARQGSPAASAVLDAERRWTQALVKGDVEALGRLYTDDLVYDAGAGVLTTDPARRSLVPYRRVG
jgi:hypothetical protein